MPPRRCRQGVPPSSSRLVSGSLSGASPRGSGATLPPAAPHRAQAGGFEHLSAPNPFTAPDPFPRPDGASYRQHLPDTSQTPPRHLPDTS